MSFSASSSSSVGNHSTLQHQRHTPDNPAIMASNGMDISSSDSCTPTVAPQIVSSGVSTDDSIATSSPHQHQFNETSTFLKQYVMDKSLTLYESSMRRKFQKLKVIYERKYRERDGMMLESSNQKDDKHGAPSLPHLLEEEYQSIRSLPQLQEHRKKVLNSLRTVIVSYLREHVQSFQQQNGLMTEQSTLKQSSHHTSSKTSPPDSTSLMQDEYCRMLTFGSCRLGVDSWNSDIDVVAVVPYHVTRHIFFHDLRLHLESDPHTACMNAVTDAYVPVLKFLFHGVPIDLLYASIQVEKIPRDFAILNEDTLYNVDEATQRALNGPRVADEILAIVPSEDKFRLTLQCVKFWAKRRGIYSNSFGYLGGIAWAILVANTCRLFPNDPPNVLLQRFFNMYRYWKWPSPVLLKRIEDGDLGFRVWNPSKYPADRAHLMPIITPAYPSMNSSFNVSRTTLRLIIEEFIRADSILNRATSIGQHFSTQDLDELFEENNFFIRYKDYLQLEVSANTPDEHRIWEAFIESRLRFLVYSLEQVGNILVHPYPHSFSDPNADSSDKTSSLFFIGLKYLKSGTPAAQQNGQVPKKVKHRIDLTPAVQTFGYKLREWDKKSSGMHTPSITSVKRSEIPEFVCSTDKKREFVNLRTTQRKRKLSELTNSNGVGHLKINGEELRGYSRSTLNGMVSSENPSPLKRSKQNGEYNPNFETPKPLNRTQSGESTPMTDTPSA